MVFSPRGRLQEGPLHSSGCRLGGICLRRRGRAGAGVATFARRVLDVDGVGTEGLSLLLGPGTTVSGVVRFEGAEPTWRDLVDLQVTTASRESVNGADEVRTAIDAGDGAFILRSLAPGPRRFGVRGLGEARVLDRITLNGRDVTDRAVTLGGGVRVAGLEIVVTDRVSQLRGLVRAGRDAAGDGAVVVVFSTDPERWFPTSRYVPDGTAGAGRPIPLPRGAPGRLLGDGGAALGGGRGRLAGTAVHRPIADRRDAGLGAEGRHR